MRKNRILVLMSSYNGEQFIDQQIDSILKQKNVDVNLLIRDDGSKDNSIQVINRFISINDRIRLIIGENIGSKNSFSELLRIVKKEYNDFDYYAFSDQDDYWESNKLDAALNIICGDNSDLPILYCSNLKVTDSDLNILGWMRPKGLVFSKDASLAESICTGCTMVFNYKAIDLYCVAVRARIMSHDLWMSHICGFLGRVYYDNDGYIFYRQHSNNQIGAHFSTLDKLKMKFSSLINLWHQHDREKEAVNFINVYNDYLKDEDRFIIGVLAYYRKNLKSRLQLLFPRKRHSIKRQISTNFWFYIRAIFGFL